MSTGRCELCNTEQQVSYQLVRWKLRNATGMFENLPRCTDRAGCQKRVENAGQEWMVDDPVDGSYSDRVGSPPS